MKTRSKSPILLSLLIATPLLQACGDGGGAWEGTVTDSAGVTVVHNTSNPIWGSGDEWTVTEELRIGTVAGEPEYQFGQLAFLDVGDDGTMYAMDILAQEVRAFDAQGNYVMTIGGPGSGPGEIGRGTVFVFVSPLGDVVIPDLGNQRVNRYGPKGEPLGSFPLQLQAGIPTRFEMDSSGRLMAQLRGLPVPGMAALEEGDPIVVYDTTGAVADTLAMLPKGQTLAGTTEGQLSMVLFSPEPLWALDETGSVFYAMNDQYRILVNDSDGALTRVITRDVAAETGGGVGPRTYPFRPPGPVHPIWCAAGTNRADYAGDRVRGFLPSVRPGLPWSGGDALGPENPERSRTWPRVQKRGSSSMPRTSDHPNGRSSMRKAVTWEW